MEVGKNIKSVAEGERLGFRRAPGFVHMLSGLLAFLPCLY